MSSSKSNYINAKHWINIFGSAHNSFSTTLGVTYARSFIKTSDINVKQNVSNLTNSLSLVLQLRGVSYNFKPESFCGDSCTSEMLTLAGQDRTHFGFISQEVAVLAPNLVVDVQVGDSQTVKALDYDEIIPLLVESIKAQQTQMDNLSTQLANCCPGMNFNKIQNDQLKSTIVDGSINKSKSLSQDFLLFQNTPNPFYDKTRIDFELIKPFSKASIFIYNFQGEQIKSYPIKNSGKGSIEINSSELKAGIYYYSLIVDNNEVNTLKMILTN